MIYIEEIAKLLRVKKKTVQNVVGEWRKLHPEILMGENLSYRIVQPLIVKKWPNHSAMFPVQFADVKKFISARR